jgi:hypothetical protein
MVSVGRDYSTLQPKRQLCIALLSWLAFPSHSASICRAWTVYAFKTVSQLTAVQCFNLIVNNFFCYRQVDMAVGFGAVRRPVSEDLIVSCYYFIRKYAVINAVVIFLVHTTSMWRQAYWRRSIRSVAVRQFYYQLPVRAGRTDSSRQCKVSLPCMGGGVGSCKHRCVNYMKQNIILNLIKCKGREPLTVHPKTRSWEQGNQGLESAQGMSV